jgi:Protein of unknown function (DUF3383)
MTNSIPASALSDVIPGVLGAGGNPLSLNSVFLTDDDSIPIGAVQPFPSLPAVQAWFGALSPEAVLAGIYFGGFIGGTQTPGTLYFVQNNSAAVSAYVRGGTVSGFSLAQIQALSGTLNLSIDGIPQASAAINLSSATSFSNAAALMTAGINNAGGRFVGTAAQTAAADVLNITAVASGELSIGDVITGAGVDAGLTILTQTGGTPGGIGTYTVSTDTGFAATTVSSAGVGTVSFDSLRGAFVVTSPTTGVNSAVTFATGTLAPGVLLTAATGAVQSIGAAPAVPATLMNGVTSAQQNWATFMTVAEQTLTVKQAFGAWVQTTDEQYAYVFQDSDPAIVAANASASAGPIFEAAGANGIIPVYDNGVAFGNTTAGSATAAFICGIGASIDFTALNGRTTFAYRGQAGLPTTVFDLPTATNLKANGYNFYGLYATRNQQFQLLQPGQITGEFDWIDSYLDQIYFNAQFQLAAVELMAQLKSLPYTARGLNLIIGAFADPIEQMEDFGAFVSGGTLSNAQQQEIIAATGDPGAPATISATGYYLQVSQASPQVRAQRGSPPSTFYYFDGGSIQQIDLSSIDVQ